MIAAIEPFHARLMHFEFINGFGDNTRSTFDDVNPLVGPQIVTYPGIRLIISNKPLLHRCWQILII